MGLFLLSIVFLTLSSPILSESPNPELPTAGSDSLTPDSSTPDSLTPFADANGFGSGTLEDLRVNADLTAFNLPFHANPPENILTNPALDPGAPASAGSPCLNDPIMDDSTANVRKRRRGIHLPDWIDALPLWCPKRDDIGVPLQPKPELPAPPPAAPTLLPSPSPAPPVLRPADQPASYPQVDGGSEYGEVRSCSMYRYKYNTVICGGPPYPTDLVQEARTVEDCWRCTFLGTFLRL